MAWFDKNNCLVCPNCHKSEGVALVWSGGNAYHGQHEKDFECGLCKCYFTVKYKIADIEIIQGENKND